MEYTRIKNKVVRILLPIGIGIGLAAALFWLLSPQHRAAATPGVVPPGTVVSYTVQLSSTDVRTVYIYEPTGYTPAVTVPLVVALHGGGGSGLHMLEDHADIWQAAERENFLVAYPDGQVIHPGQPNRHFWAMFALNLAYLEENVLNTLTTTYAVDSSRIYFVGFSGGAQLIYYLAADPEFSQRLAGIGTVAGPIGAGADCPSMDILDPRLGGGKPLPALLIQGALDPRTPIDGGYDDEHTLNASYRDKVDVWVNHINGDPAGSPTIPQAPTNTLTMLYENPATNDAVLALVDPQLRHAWPHDWPATGNGEGAMGAFWDFFERYPAASELTRSLLITSDPTGCIYPSREITFTLGYTNPSPVPLDAQGVFRLPHQATLLGATSTGSTGVITATLTISGSEVAWTAGLDPGGRLQIDARLRVGECPGSGLFQLNAEALADPATGEPLDAAHFVLVGCVPEPDWRLYLPVLSLDSGLMGPSP